LAGHDIIVIGASAGGVEGLKHIVPEFPADLPASIFIVMHLPSEAKSFLPEILERLTTMKVVSVTNGLTIQPGHIYIARPDYHMLLEMGFIRLVHGPKENRHRPAIDPLFRSAARAYKSRVLGVILSGNLDDGTAGLKAVKQCGGIAIVQDPEETIYDSMPRSALANVDVDYCLPLMRIPSLLTQLAQTPSPNGGDHIVPEHLDLETKFVTMEADSMDQMDKLGSQSSYTCPECHGALWEMKESNLLRFRCHVGHAFSADSLQLEQNEALEDSLWAAVRALQEISSMNQRLAIRARERNNNEQLAARFAEKALRCDRYANQIREILIDSDNQVQTD
jgi:two-component system, chemotaxis family, protein-glutamate methylesterase/glutaminase